MSKKNFSLAEFHKINESLEMFNDEVMGMNIMDKEFLDLDGEEDFDLEDEDDLEDLEDELEDEVEDEDEDEEEDDGEDEDEDDFDEFGESDEDDPGAEENEDKDNEGDNQLGLELDLDSALDKDIFGDEDADLIDDALMSLIDEVGEDYEEESAVEAVYDAIEALVTDGSIDDIPKEAASDEEKAVWVQNSMAKVREKLQSLGIELEAGAETVGDSKY